MRTPSEPYFFIQPSTATTVEAPRFYSVSQVARMLGMSTMTLYRAISAGEFPALRVRGRLIVPAKALEAMVDSAIAEQTLIDASAWVPQAVTRS